MLFRALTAAFKLALPKTKPFTGAVSEEPEAQVNTTGPDIAVTAFKSVRALAIEVYVLAKAGVVLLLPVTVIAICALVFCAKNKAHEAITNPFEIIDVKPENHDLPAFSVAFDFMKSTLFFICLIVLFLKSNSC
jgi:hypothetical protein